MATLEKIENDIKKTKKRIADEQKKLKSLEAQKKDAANMEIVNLVKAVKMDKATLTVFLKAYAKGDIELPDEYVQELETVEAENAADEETEDADNEE